jgi:hypothetical protein
MRHASDDDFGGAFAHLACRRDPVPEPFDEEPAVGIEHDLDDCGIVECNTKPVPERVLKLSDEAWKGAQLVHAGPWATCCLAQLK